MAETTAPRIEYFVLAAAILVGIAHRLIFGWFAPFWLDEAYTGVIATQPSVAGLIQWCRHEMSGPFYYGSMWVWERFAGDSNLALRLPSLIASLGAVVLVAAYGGSNRRERWLWAGLTAIWLPGLLFVAQARPQTLLFLLATAQTIAFLRCIDTRSPRWLTIWSAIGALMILTHIHAAVITGLEFLCILWTLRPRLREIWPALAIFGCVAAWLPLQLPFMTGILKPGAAWYPVLGVRDLWRVPFYLFGANLAAFAIVTIVLGILATQWVRRRSAGIPLPYARSEVMLTVSALLSVALVVGVGFLRPSFEPRYLIPYMPALLFGLTVVLCRTHLLLSLLPSIVLASWAGAAVQNVATYAAADAQQALNPLEFERGSDWLMHANAHRVIFVWDNPTSQLGAQERQTEVGAFFFRRAGYTVDVQAIYLASDHQSASNLAALADTRGAAILWVGGAIYPAGLHDMAQFDCRDFGGDTSRSIACIRKIGSATARVSALQDRDRD
ncbi:glycosyltransferase family 39 protein [Sphingomonas sp. JC676]|uniref:glycosyltransferase family 39 protein n=1 Tax=Sphingomonas sp. JC676 TaxID=2768065 RepID=UPI0016580C07|nr:glycosyltransferase family 39 protein [Sphingomonas sp. JC676]MBC9034093.1 glycosyltransferase family 39 protein [Sphingomonas sp. JC676]